MDLKTFYNHITMCLNVVTILREDLLPAYQSIKRHSELEEYFVPDRDHPSYSWNSQIYTSLGKSVLVELNNDTCVKYSMEHQSYNVVNTHAHETLICTIVSSHIWGINGNVKSELATLIIKKEEQLEYFHSIIIRIQQ